MASVYEHMIAAACALDRRPAPPPDPCTPNGSAHDSGDRPGDLFNAQASWQDVLGPHGWVCVYERGGMAYWRRPGKDRGISATTGVRPDCGKDLLYVFTTSTELDAEKSYSKFGTYAQLDHGGDFAAAARALAAAGYRAPDPWEGVKVRLSGNGEAAAHTASDPLRGKIIRIPASQLRKLAAAEKWLWKGIIPAEMVSIFSALPKAGKTTLLSHLLRAVEADGQFCGQEVRAARVVYVTEESETIWADRRDKLGLKDHCEFVLRPFRSKPSLAEWMSFITALNASLKENPAELVVVDTLAKLWPVKNENDASEVTEALMPLLEIAYGLRSSLVLVHHLRKTDGLEATATRGSGGITAAVDCILELRRYKPGDRQDTRRVLHCDARFDDRLDECVIQLENGAYKACGDRRDTARDDAIRTIQEVLGGPDCDKPPGLNTQQIIAAGWEEGPVPTKQTILDALRYGTEAGEWRRETDGHKGSPYTYWRP